MQKRPLFQEGVFNNYKLVSIFLEDEQLALSRTPPNR